MSKCPNCHGRGRKSEPCVVCDDKGSVTLVKSWHACLYCSTLRCIACGGDGYVPTPLKPILSIVPTVQDL